MKDNIGRRFPKLTKKVKINKPLSSLKDIVFVYVRRIVPYLNQMVRIFVF